MPKTTRHELVQAPGQSESICGSKPDPSALTTLFDEWMHGDEAEQQETFKVLRGFLDENRPEGYKFFS